MKINGGESMASKFRGIAIKSLSSVEINHFLSNQHEFNGVTELRRIFGVRRQSLRGDLYYVHKNGIIIKDTASLTWYNARENHPNRTEYRFYYSDNVVVNNAKEDDILLVAVNDSNRVKIVIIEKGTQFIDVLKVAMGLKVIENKYQIVDNIELSDEIVSYLD